MFLEDASTDSEATDPKFDDVKFITRSEEGKIIILIPVQRTFKPYPFSLFA